MARGVSKDTKSIVRFKCPVCGYKQSKKSKARGKYVVYETKYTWILKCCNPTCEGKVVIKKREEDINIRIVQIINERTILDKLNKIRGLVE